MQKYLKLNSLSWWASFTPVVVGVVIATQPLHNQTALVQSLSDIGGGMPPGVLINTGLAGIGIRGAIGQ